MAAGTLHPRAGFSAERRARQGLEFQRLLCDEGAESALAYAIAHGMSDGLDTFILFVSPSSHRTALFGWAVHPRDDEASLRLTLRLLRDTNGCAAEGINSCNPFARHSVVTQILANPPGRFSIFFELAGHLIDWEATINGN